MPKRALLAVAILALVGCGGIVFIAQPQRVTFALVLDSRLYTGEPVVAQVKQPNQDISDPWQLPVMETLTAPLANYPNTTNQDWAQFTTLEKIPTNARYILTFFIDMNGNGIMDAGDLSGVQFFDVMPNAVWSETKYYSSELTTVS
jgi:hypothetical protein